MKSTNLELLFLFVLRRATQDSPVPVVIQVFQDLL